MKVFASGFLAVFITSFIIQILDINMTFYDYRIVLGVLGGYYGMPVIRKAIEKRI